MEAARGGEARPSRAWRSAPRRGLTCLWSLPASPSAMWPRERLAGRRLPKSKPRGRGSEAPSGGRVAALCDPEPQPGPRRAARICFRVAGQLVTGSPYARGARRPCRPPSLCLLAPLGGSRPAQGDRRPSRLCLLENRLGWGFQVAPCGLGTTGPSGDVGESGLRPRPGRGSTAAHSPRLVFAFQGGFGGLVLFCLRVLIYFVLFGQEWV